MPRAVGAGWVGEETAETLGSYISQDFTRRCIGRGDEDDFQGGWSSHRTHRDDSHTSRTTIYLNAPFSDAPNEHLA